MPVEYINFRKRSVKMGGYFLRVTLSALLCERVLAAIVDKISVNIMGSGSKAFYGRPAQGELLAVAQYRGIISYEPTELVMTPLWYTPG